MISPAQEELLQAMRTLWEEFPHWRLGQLVLNVAGWADINPWDVEDEQLLHAIREQQVYRKAVHGPEVPHDTAASHIA